MTDQAKSGFVLPLWEVLAHFSCWNMRSVETEMDGSDEGDAHSSIDVSTDFRVLGFLLLLGKQDG
jgi:hypothetical protein